MFNKTKLAVAVAITLGAANDTTTGLTATGGAVSFYSKNPSLSGDEGYVTGKIKRDAHRISAPVRAWRNPARVSLRTRRRPLWPRRSPEKR